MDEPVSFSRAPGFLNSRLGTMSCECTNGHNVMLVRACFTPIRARMQACINTCGYLDYHCEEDIMASGLYLPSQPFFPHKQKRGGAGDTSGQARTCFRPTFGLVRTPEVFYFSHCTSQNLYYQTLQYSS